MNPEITFETANQNPSFEGVSDIHPQEAHRLAKRVRLIDVRQLEEYHGELGHVTTAELIPLDTLPEHLPGIDKKETIIFICRSGGRSARATAFAQSIGFDNVYNMKGGMLLWNELSLPVEKS